MHVDFVDPQKLDRARALLGTTSTRATLDLALELLLAQSDFIEADRTSGESAETTPSGPLEWE